MHFDVSMRQHSLDFTGEAMDVDESAAAGAAVTEQGTEHAHLHQCQH